MKILNSIFDTESKNIYIFYIGSNKYIIREIKCWPVFKQDPKKHILNNYCANTNLVKILYKDILYA